MENNAFHWAARIGNAQILRKIAESLTFNQIMMLLNTPTQDQFKMKPLSIAAKFDHMEAFAFLCELEFSTEELKLVSLAEGEAIIENVLDSKRILEDAELM